MYSLLKNYFKFYFFSECEKTVNILYVAIFVIVAIVLLGILALILWKVIITWKDNREYARFDREISTINWKNAPTESKLYHPATSSFKNPTYSSVKQEETTEL